LALWSTLPFLLLHAGGLVVDTPSPDAFCPALEQTRNVIAARLGTVELEGTWQASYVSVHRAEGEFVVLSLRDPQGNVRLEREFPVQEGSCVTLSQVIALVLERYFSRPEPPRVLDALESQSAEDVVSNRTPMTPETPQITNGNAQTPSDKNSASRGTVRPSASTTTHQQSPAQSSVLATLSPPVEPNTRTKTAFRSDVGLALANGWFAPSVAFAASIAPTRFLELGASYDLHGHDEPVLGGIARLDRFPFALQWLQLLPATPWANLELGAGMLGLLERGRTQGLGTSEAKTRFVPGLQVSLGASFLGESRSVVPYIRVFGGLAFRGLTPPFQVAKETILEPPSAVVGASFGLRFRF